MKRWLALLLACLALSLVVAGCGGDDEESGDDAQNTEQPAEDSGGAEKDGGEGQADGGAEVSMKDIKFVPNSVSVSVGDAVTWTNDDTVGTRRDRRRLQVGRRRGHAERRHLRADLRQGRHVRLRVHACTPAWRAR